MEANYEIPCVKIFYHNKIKDIKKINHIVFGLEEEGIPFELSPQDEVSDIKLSYNASLNSKVEVGIGVNSSLISLHYRKLDANKPLFTIKFDDEIENLRKLGTNAARLVKGIPFK